MTQVCKEVKALVELSAGTENSDMLEMSTDTVKFFGYKQCRVICIAYLEDCGASEGGGRDYHCCNTEYYLADNMVEVKLAMKAFIERLKKPWGHSPYARALDSFMPKDV